jgi:hypothetical protein
MTVVAWMLGALIAAGLGYAAWRGRAQWLERKRAAEERMASFVAQAAPQVHAAAAAAPQPAIDSLAASQQKLLLDAASKAGEAGEPVLAIQLYARLLSRYPNTAFAGQARAAVAAQKKKLAKA